MPKFTEQSPQKVTAEMIKQTHLAARFAKGYLAKLVANPPQNDEDLINFFNSAIVAHGVKKTENGDFEKHPLFEDLNNSLQGNQEAISLSFSGLVEGVATYKARNGGEMPNDTVFAAAFSDAQCVLDY